MPKNRYVVVGSRGEYSDRVEWPVCVVKTEADSQILTVRLEHHVRGLIAAYKGNDPYRHDDEDAALALLARLMPDPYLKANLEQVEYATRDYNDGVRYTYHEVPTKLCFPPMPSDDGLLRLFPLTVEEPYTPLPEQTVKITVVSAKQLIDRLTAEGEHVEAKRITDGLLANGWKLSEFSMIGMPTTEGDTVTAAKEVTS
jgi:hypothetical protein